MADDGRHGSSEALEEVRAKWRLIMEETEEKTGELMGERVKEELEVVSDGMKVVSLEDDKR